MKVYVELDRNKMKNIYFNRMMGTIIEGLTGNESAQSIIMPLANKLGVTFDKQYELIKNSTQSTFLRAYMESLMDTIDISVEKYAINHNGRFRIDEEKVNIANEAATDELMTGDDSDTMGSTLSDMIKEMLDKKLNDIKDITKLALKLEKDRQDGEKEDLLDENKEIEEEEESEDNEDAENAFNGEGDEEEGSEEGGNPFGEDNNEADNSTDGGETSEDDNNPFGEPSGDSSDNGSSDDNPFGSSEDEGEDSNNNSEEGGSNDNPFGDAGSSSDSSENKDEGAGNPFESVNDISKITIGGAKPFFGLNNGDLSGFVTSQTRLVFENPMREIYDKFGSESVEFKDMTKRLKLTNQVALEGVITVATVLPLLGFRPNMDAVKYWDVYVD